MADLSICLDRYFVIIGHFGQAGKIITKLFHMNEWSKYVPMHPNLKGN